MADESSGFVLYELAFKTIYVRKEKTNTQLAQSNQLLGGWEFRHCPFGFKSFLSGRDDILVLNRPSRSVMMLELSNRRD